MKSPNVIKLESDDWLIEISPDHGAAILSCRYQGVDVLRPTPRDWFQHPDLLASSCFPLVPFSNRIENGTFQFDNINVELAKNCVGEQHPIHGIGWQSPWQITTQSPAGCELAMEYPAGDWPWPFTAVQKIEIIDRHVNVSLVLTNAGSSEMPAGLGFHPYFNNAKTARLDFQADGVWLSAADCLPRKWVPTPELWDFTHGKPLAELAIDHCFTGWTGSARVSWSDTPLKLSIETNAQDGFAVLYVPADENYFCFEPVSHMTNAVNWTDKTDKTGLRILGPGETSTFDMRISVT